MRRSRRLTLCPSPMRSPPVMPTRFRLRWARYSYRPRMPLPPLPLTPPRSRKSMPSRFKMRRLRVSLTPPLLRRLTPWLLADTAAAAFAEAIAIAQSHGLFVVEPYVETGVDPIALIQQHALTVADAIAAGLVDPVAISADLVDLENLDLARVTALRTLDGVTTPRTFASVTPPRTLTRATRERHSSG